METKTCSRCREEKPRTLEFFGWGKQRNNFKPHCRECGKLDSRTRYAQNIEEMRVRDRINSKKRYSDPEKRANRYAKHKEWQLKNPEKVMGYRAKRRAVQLSNRTNALEEWVSILSKDPCTYCGLTISETIDHATPISKGGTDSVVNLTGACKSCNSSKKDKTFIECLIDKQKEIRSNNYAY